MQDALRKYWPIAVGLVVILLFSTRFIAPPPPKSVEFASGAEQGAYALTATKYKALFEDKNISLNIQNTSGSGDNLERLRNGEVGAAIVQGGLVTDEDAATLSSLGAIFFEPLWVFYRAELSNGTEVTDEIRDLDGLRIAGGSVNSGTRGLINSLFAENGVEARLIDMGSSEGAKALQAGQIDVLVTVSAPTAPHILTLLKDPDIAVLNFDRALAYERRTPYLKQVIFPEGGLDLEANIPSEPIELIAPAAQVVVRNDLHPAVQALLIESMVHTHRQGTLLSEPGTFPTPNRVDLPLAEEAERYYEQGPSFLRRLFPFTVANFLERAWVLAIPLVTLIFPLVRAAPPIYRWRTRRKIYVWYKDLRELEVRGRNAQTDDEREAVIIELKLLQAEVGRVEVPESYTDELYRLRSHILFVSQLVQRLDEIADAKEAREQMQLPD